MNLIDIIFIIFISILCLLSLLKKKSRLSAFNIKTTEIINKHYTLFVILLFIIAVFIRSYKFGIIPYGLNQDEAMAGLEGFNLSQYGTDHYGTHMPVYFTAWIHSQMNVLLSYVLIPFFKIFGVSVFTLRLPMLIFSIISLWVIYRFSYKLLGKNAALAVLFIVSINPWQIMMSRWALEANLFPHLMLYGTYFLYLGIEKKRYLYFAMIAFAAAMYSYGIAYYAVPLFLLIMCIYFLRKKIINLKNTLLCALTYFSLSWPIFLMMIVNKFQLDTIKLPFATIEFFEYGERMNDVLFFSENIFDQFVQNFIYTMKASIFQSPDIPWNSIPQIGPLYFVTIPLFILGIFLFIFGKNLDTSNIKKHARFIILAMFGVAFISGLITNNVNINRLNSIFFPMIILIGYGLYYVCKNFKIALLPIILIFTFLFSNFTYEYFVGKHSQELGESFYMGFEKSLLYVKDMEYERLYITPNTQGELFMTSQIITLFILEIDNDYYYNKIDEYDSRGNKYMPYGRRYIYQIKPELIEPSEIGAIYILHTSEKEYFEEEFFNFVQFDDYYVAINKDYTH